ncbi:uncharacterized protein N7483_006346 [Penicillium malachiteum]|uniref:uncharacterized protein n=1 Tax=Penicillium malachiteum TaxID=1324776 RepID=UPI002549A1AB|nr:uncharacterized protein N7483_006346 [Penicillium malachiteum]KAJ5724989.1 hypothetical protein N7483_006346 [Penicillium malachiteum]
MAYLVWCCSSNWYIELQFPSSTHPHTQGFNFNSRAGPTEISLLEHSAIDSVYGARSPCNKAPWYDMGDPTEFLHSVRIKDKHDARRRIWSKCLSPRALREFEEREVTYVDLMITQIRKRAGEPLNITHWINFFIFDVIAEFAFGQPFGMVARGILRLSLQFLGLGESFSNFPHTLAVPHDLKHGVHSRFSVDVIYVLCYHIIGKAHSPLVHSIFPSSSYLFSSETTDGRQDFMSVLFEEADKQNQTTEARRWLSGDCHLVIVAGR